MIKKNSFLFFAFSALTAVAACRYKPNNSVTRAEVWQPQIQMPGSVVVCRSKQCAPSKLSMSKEYIYNSLLHLLDNNTQNKALICAADSASHVCTEEYITLPITVGVTPANMYIDDVKITDVSASLGNKSLNLVLNYNVTYNGQSPVCKPAQSLVYVKNASNIIMEDAGYSCKMTTIGNTTIKTLFAIDYIDLDYGYIGGYYSIGLSGPAYGGDSGYMMLRLPNDAYPLAPALTAPEPVRPIAASAVPEPQPAQAATPANTNVKQAATETTPAAASTKTEPAKKKTPTAKAKTGTKKPATAKKAQKESGDKTKQKAKTSAKKSEKITPPANVKPIEIYEGVQIFPLPPKKAVASDTDAAKEAAPGTTLKEALNPEK